MTSQALGQIQDKFVFYHTKRSVNTFGHILAVQHKASHGSCVLFSPPVFATPVH